MADSESISDIIKGIQNDVQTIVKGEIELIKAEIVPQIKSAGLGVGMFGAAGYFVLTASILAFFTLALLLALAFGAAGFDTLTALVIGFAIITVLLFIIAVVLVLVGKGRFAFTKPNKAIDSAEQSVASVRQAVVNTAHEIAETPLIAKDDQPKVPSR